MPLEIERKFLLKDESWRQHTLRGLASVCVQGYLSLDKERTVRVRSKGNEGFITVKGPKVGTTCLEYEYPIPLRDAQEMLTMCIQPLITKVRHIVVIEGVVWEIDEFKEQNAGLIVAEVEYESCNQEIDIPAWIGKEVTEDKRYANANLVTHPFSQW